LGHVITDRDGILVNLSKVEAEVGNP